MMVILDNGHGGMIGGEYQTRGKRSPAWRFGTLYEGAFNRWICGLVMRELDAARVPYFHVSPEHIDVPLRIRAARANAIAARHPDAYLVSIHANAGGGHGLEVFTSRGRTLSDAIATQFLRGFASDIPGTHIRRDTSDGDGDKEAEFFMLTRTTCPAVLIELAFMDHPDDYTQLWSQDQQHRWACSIANTICTLHEQGGGSQPLT